MLTIISDRRRLAHFDRERVPERVVHAKGGGAHGFFEVTHDISDLTCAQLFEKVGTQVRATVRFSTVGGEQGTPDVARDPRGFSIKLRTEEGNWDHVYNNTPVFFLRDATKFPHFIHTQKRDPQTHLKDNDMFWDYLSQNPESFHQVSANLCTFTFTFICIFICIFTSTLTATLTSTLTFTFIRIFTSTFASHGP